MRQEGKRFDSRRNVMRPPRVSIVRLMAVVGVVAVNLAVFRPLFDFGPEALIGVGLAWILLQVALFRLIRSRGRARTFWVGYLAFGAVATSLFFWAVAHPRNIGIGRTATQEVRIEVPGSPLWDMLEAYTRFASVVIEQLPLLPIVPGAYGEVVGLITIAVLWLVPQVLFALVGGLLACALLRLAEKRAERAGIGSGGRTEPLLLQSR
jgi:hypothetical protein